MKSNASNCAQVFLNNEQKEVTQFPIDIEQFALRVIQHLKLDVDYIDVTLLNSKKITELNDQYFKVNLPTDTISFNLTPEAAITGDIYLCPKVIKDNAVEYKNSFMDELKTVIIHSILHLSGEEDNNSQKYERMKSKQDAIFKELNL